MIALNLQSQKTVDLLEHYARYVARNDDISATPGALIEGILLAFLDEHDGFRNYLSSLPIKPAATPIGRSLMRLVSAGG